MKTPEEIKKGMECVGGLIEPCVSGCPYEKCCECGLTAARDAIEYIQQLETRLAQVERERDAAVNDLTNSAPCFACLQFIRNGGTCKGGRRCLDEQFRTEIGVSEYDGKEWQWRGVCEENTKEE